MEALTTPCKRVSCKSWAIRMRSARRSSKRWLSLLVTCNSHAWYKAHISAAAVMAVTKGNHQLRQMGGQAGATAAAKTPSVGSVGVVQGGWNPGPTSNAAYSRPG